MNRIGKAGVAILAAVAVISTSIAVMDHLPKEDKNPDYEVIGEEYASSIDVWFPERMSGNPHIIYYGEDITPKCYLMRKDDWHLCIRADMYIDKDKMEIRF